jgi:osmoprotectant transport system ATP-binding protein
MIELKAISKKFGDTQAVNQVSFKVDEKETLVLLGTSGCGKTTTLKMINRLIEPDAGEVFINGENIINQDPDVLRTGIGYVMQNIGLFSALYRCREYCRSTEAFKMGEGKN